jgi:putative membrane protein
MKRLLRHYAINTFSLYLINIIAGGIVFEDGIKTLLLAGVGLTVASVFARPVINLLLLPINLVTFGLFRWLANAVALYLVALIVHGFKIVEFNFAGYTSPWIDLPGIHLTGLLAFVGFSFILSFITTLIYWIVK